MDKSQLEYCEETDTYYELCNCLNCLGAGGNDEPNCHADEDGRIYAVYPDGSSWF